MLGGAAMAGLDFAYDLTLDEVRRRSVVLEAIGDDWDPIAVLAKDETRHTGSSGFRVHRSVG
jgi:hypothetical protein